MSNVTLLQKNMNVMGNVADGNVQISINSFIYLWIPNVTLYYFKFID